MYTETNTYLYIVKWFIQGDKLRLHEKANAFALYMYLASDLYCSIPCTTSDA